MDTNQVLLDGFNEWSAGGGLSTSLGMIGDRPSDTATDWSQYLGGQSAFGGGAATYSTDSGLLQQSAATMLGYLGKRLDIDLYGRAAQATVQPQLRSTQNGVMIRKQTGTVGGLTTTTTSLNLGALLPWLLIGGAAYLMTR